MAEIDNKKPEQAPKAKPDDSTAHALTVFAQSLAYTAVEAPTRGVAQAADHIFGTKLEEGVQAKLANAGVHQPETAAYGTKAWTAQQFGNGIGTVVPMWLARKAMVGKAEQALVETTKVEGGFVVSLKHASLVDSALHEMKLSAKTGFLYGAAFTPTEDQNSSGNILVDRLKQGFNSGVTFGAMGYSSSFTSGMLGRAASSLESTALPSVFKSPLKTVLHSSLIHGAIGGVSGGAIQAQLGAMESGKPLASLQDFKENIISMTMVGGTMGSAGLFKEASSKSSLDIQQRITKPLTDTLSALHKDSFAHAIPDAISDRSEEHIQVGGRDKSSAQFNIRFGPIKEALPAAEVNRFMTTETRSIEFARKDMESSPLYGHWNRYADWAIEKRDVEVNVYRFPGLKTEIVVPSDYARSLDQIREQRLQFMPGGDGELIVAKPEHVNRILPEEVAQMLKFLPQSDSVHTVELLDHASPWDPKNTHEVRVKAAKDGEEPELQPDFVALADANSRGNTRRIRYFESSTHEPHQMQRTTFHEWSHILQSQPAFVAFAAAARLEKQGFFARKYARKNESENWAVHLGERFLSPSGANFAMLPEKAPARTLVMAKAVRDMLREREDNPSPRHTEFLKRIEAAENKAASNLTQSIVDDINNRDTSALQEKLEFLNITASSAKSPEILERVLSPFDDRLEPFLQKANVSIKVVDEIMAHRQAARLAADYSPEKMPLFMQRWRNVVGGNALESLYRTLPESGQQYLREDLIHDPTGGARYFLTRMIEGTKGDEQKLFRQTFKTAEENIERNGLELSERNERIPFEYEEWMENSVRPNVRLAVLKSSSPVTAWNFGNVIDGLPPPALRYLLAQDALKYVAPEYRSAAWLHALDKLPENEKAKLFSQISDKRDFAAFELMSATAGDANNG